MRRLALALLLFAVSPVLAQAPPSGFITVSGTRIFDAGVPLVRGLISAQLISKGQTYPASLGGGGQNTSTPITGRILNGAFSFALPDVNLTNPQNACLAVTIADAAGNAVARYPCVQPSSAATGPSITWCATVSGVTTCNFDLYSQALPALAMSTPGPPGRDGAPGAPGPSGSSVNAQYLDSNGNLTIPPTALSTVKATNFGATAAYAMPCLFTSLTAYTGAAQAYPICHSLNALFLEPGWSSTAAPTDPSPNAYRWFVPSAHQINLLSYSSGITNGFGVAATKTAGGDFNPANFNGAAKQATTNGADEGAVFLRNQNVEITAPFGGVAVNSTSAATILSVSCVANCGNLGPQHPLIDTAPSKIVTATLTAQPVTTPYGAGSPGHYATLTFPGTPFTPSNCAVLTSPVATPQQKITQKTPMVLHLGSQSGLTFSGFAAGQTVVMGGPGFWESAIVQGPGGFAGGTQTLSAALTYPHDTGGLVCSGGLAGYYAEQATFTALANNVKYMFYVLATPTASTAIVAQNGPGYFNTPFFPGVYNFYPGATVTDASGILPLISRDARTGQVQGIGTGTVTVGLDVNTMQIAPGDPLVNASLAGATYLNQSSLLTVNNPFAAADGISHHVRNTSVNGQGGFTVYADYLNSATANPLLVPKAAFRALSPNNSDGSGGGPFAAGLLLNEYPVGGVECGNHYPAAMMAIWCRQGPLRAFDVWGDYTLYNSTPANPYGFNAFHYDPSTGTLGINFQHLNLAPVPSLQIVDSATGAIHTLTISNGSLVVN